MQQQKMNDGGVVVGVFWGIYCNPSFLFFLFFFIFVFHFPRSPITLLLGTVCTR